jgi:hypothetical protein
MKSYLNFNSDKELYESIIRITWDEMKDELDYDIECYNYVYLIHNFNHKSKIDDNDIINENEVPPIK